jgi:hypothetical protein
MTVRTPATVARPLLRVLRRTQPATRYAIVVCAFLSAAYLAWTPKVPDLAAQVARAGLVDQVGLTAWWTGWFGGITLPDYSVLGPWSMALVGVRVAGLLAVVAGSVALARLTAGALRPRAAAVAFAVAGMANLLDGRVSFAIGLGVGAWAVVALQARRPVLLWLAVVGCYLASPLAALFLGMVLLTVAYLDAARRRTALTGAGLLAVLALGMGFLFADTGRMPFRFTDIIPPGLCCLAVALWSQNRYVRVAAFVLLAALGGFYLLPSPVGTNVTRLVWVCAVPLVLAYCRLRGLWLVALVALVAIWPIADLSRQLGRADSPSASASFYPPLERALTVEQQRAGPVGVGQRLEVVDSADHWAVVYLRSAMLARGWDRQADAANNPIFYQPGQLTASSYYVWLQQLAVGWVALPQVTHDYAAKAEAELVRNGLPYLQPVWASPSWTLYRVTGAQPLAVGATVARVDATGVDLNTTGSATVQLRLRWSPYLTVRTAAGQPVPGACLRRAGDWTELVVPAAGGYRVGERFDPFRRLHPDGGCIP